MLFKAKKSIFVKVLILIVAIIPILYLLEYIEQYQTINFWIGLLFALVPLVIIVWAYFTTKYIIKANQLHYTSAFLSGTIEINEIKKIINGKTLYVGVKPALAAKGLIIKYHFDEVYIAPENNDAMIAELLKINPNIIVESHK